MQVLTENRLNWKDPDWAAYLGCPVDCIPRYRQILDNNFLPAIEREQKSGLYSLVMYRYDMSPSGTKRLCLLFSGKQHFVDAVDALRNANTVISNMKLMAMTAKTLQVPATAIQMMLIRTK